MSELSVAAPGDTNAPTTPDLAVAIDDTTLVALRHAVPSVLMPGEDGYEAAVTPWNVSVAPEPVAVVPATSASEIASAVRVANRLGLQVTVQATGHGVSSDMNGTLLVSTRSMRGLVVDADSRTARAEAGVTWDQVLTEGAVLGLAGLAGSAPDVGVVGYLTGGGVGPMARTHGLASDRVTAFEVVTGDGQLRRATATENPELFWGLRGGKGLLGIVTAVEFELLPIADIYGGAIYFDGADAADVLHRWSSWSADLPREATTSLALLRLPPLPSIPPPLAGKLVVGVRYAWAGETARGEQVLEAMRSVATPIIDTVAVMPYSALGSIHSDPVDPMPTHEAHALLERFDDAGVEALLEVAGPASASAQVVVEVRQLGGAIGDGAPSSSAFDARHGAYSLMLIGIGVPPVVADVAADAARVLEAMAPITLDVALPNFAPRAGTAWLERTYKTATLQRLGRASAAYDPKSVISGSQYLPRPTH